MEPGKFSIPGYRVNEYLLVLAPPEELRSKIARVKDEFADKYTMPSARLLKPHIALVSFLALDMMEDKILHRVQNIAMGITPFKIELKDYSAYPTHTIFIQVTSKLPIQNLVKQLKEAQRLMRLNAENKPHFMEEPHIAIARKLKPWQFEKAWLEYSHRQFTGRFIADHLLLIKRRAGERSAYQIVKRFDFQDLPVLTLQGSFF